MGIVVLLLIGQFAYMEIKAMKNTIGISIFLILFNANQLIAEDFKDIPISKAKSVYLKSENENSKKVLNHIDKKEYKLFQNSLVYKINIDNNLINPLSQKVSSLKRNNNNNNKIKNNIVGKYLFAFNEAEANSMLNSLSMRYTPESLMDNTDQLSNSMNERLNKEPPPKPILIDKFRVIQDKNSRIFFTDGSLVVKFNTNVNFSEFASLYNLKLKKEFVDLNLGIYEHDNFNSLEDKIDMLKDINTISDVQYNIINPYILAH